jgi:hypothetical protein
MSANQLQQLIINALQRRKAVVGSKQINRNALFALVEDQVGYAICGKQVTRDMMETAAIAIGGRYEVKGNTGRVYY